MVPSLGWMAIIDSTVNVRSLAASFINVERGSLSLHNYLMCSPASGQPSEGVVCKPLGMEEGTK